MVKRIFMGIITAALLMTMTGCATKMDTLNDYCPPNKGDEIAVMKTSMGDIYLRFFPNDAPLAVENFKTLAKQGYYNGLIFHRVISGFMIQSGDPLGTGRGGQSMWGTPFKNETTDSARNFRGALAMANAGADTNGSQFYIVQTKTVSSSLLAQMKQYPTRFPSNVIDMYQKDGGSPSLDGGYTVFGYAFKGMDVVDEIDNVKTDSKDKPITDVKIISVTIEKYEGDAATSK